MRVLFDNNVPAPLRHRLTRHMVDTAKEMSWQELKNGDLLSAAEQVGFQVMVTGDKNLAYQQNLEGRTLALVVLPTIDWAVLKRDPATLSEIAEAVDRATPGSFEALPDKTSPRRASGRSAPQL